MKHGQEIKIKDIDISKISKIEATSQTVMVTMYDGSYINIDKKLIDLIKFAG